MLNDYVAKTIKLRHNDDLVSDMTDEELATETLETRLRVVEELGLRELSDPYFKGKGLNFETIK